MSYIIPARSKALGAQGGLADPDYEIKNEVDMKAQYDLSDIRFDHSAQFFSTNIRRQQYWTQVMKVFRVN